MTEAPTVFMWMGRRMQELTRDELLDVIEWLAQENQRLTADRNRWQRSGDAIKYLMDGKQ